MTYTRLLLIRHGATATTGVAFPQRDGAEPVSPEGAREIATLACWLSRKPIHQVYCSPARRAWETATVVASQHQLDPIIDDGLMEVDMGDWAGRTLAWAQGRPEWRQFTTDFFSFTFPGGESVHDLVARTATVVDRVIEDHHGETVALVGHFGTAIAALTHLEGRPHGLELSLPPGNFVTVDLDEDGTVSTSSGRLHAIWPDTR